MQSEYKDHIKVDFDPSEKLASNRFLYSYDAYRNIIFSDYTKT
ncbi:MAG: hypothetical protein QXS74_09945 [Nitrososphaeria archaeon]